MSHPRLTRVLADWCRRHNEDLGYADDPDMEAYVASLIATDEEGIADRLEEALGKCSVCDAPPGRHDLNAAYAKAAGTSYHPVRAGRRGSWRGGCGTATEGSEVDERPSPHELYRQAGGDRERYVALMKEHGHLVAKHEGVFDPTLPPGGWVCGVDGCLAPIETEPCDEHCPGPDAHLSEARRILGIDGGQ